MPLEALKEPADKLPPAAIEEKVADYANSLVGRLEGLISRPEISIVNPSIQLTFDDSREDSLLQKEGDLDQYGEPKFASYSEKLVYQYLTGDNLLQRIHFIPNVYLGNHNQDTEEFDLFFPDHGIVIEVDGPHHRASKDKLRNAFCNRLGLRLIRVDVRDRKFTEDRTYREIILNDLVKILKLQLQSPTLVKSEPISEEKDTKDSTSRN